MSDDHEPMGASQGRALVIQRLLAVGQLDRARELLGSWLAHDPDDLDALLMMARVELADDRPQGALAAVEQVIAREPDLSAAHRVLGLALLQLGRFAEAERALLRAIELEPSDATSRETYAHILSALQQHRRALTVASDALQLDPDDSDLHALQARLLLVVAPEDIEVSEEAAIRSVRLDPESSDAHAVLGMVQLKQAEHDAAETSFRRALMSEPTNALALHGLALVTMDGYPLYKPMLWYASMMRRLDHNWQIGVLLGAWALVEAIRQLVSTIPSLAGTAPYISYAYFAFCAYTWFATPITVALLKRRHPWLNDAGL